MPKTKNRKYERVRQLANVFMPEPATADLFLPWRQAGSVFKGLILELGCGKGEHSLAFAARYPDRCVVGVDMKSHRLCDGGESGLAAGLDNLFFLRTDIKHIEHYFHSGSVSEIWITFPDPHPKQREIKHRLTSPDFMAAYSRLLVPGGIVHLKTDSDLLYAFTREGVGYWGGRILDATEDLHHSDLDGTWAGTIVSTFEGKALARGKTIKYLKFELN